MRNFNAPFSTNYSLDSKNAVRVADFDKSIKWAEEPEQVMSDLEVISVVGELFHLSASLFIHYPIIFYGQLEDIPILTRKEGTFKAFPQCSLLSLPCRQWHFPRLVWIGYCCSFFPFLFRSLSPLVT